MQNETTKLRNQARGIKRIFVYVSSFALLFLLVGCSSEKYSKIPLLGVSVSYCPECGDASRQCRCESSFNNRVTTEPLIIGIDKEDGDLWIGWKEDMVDKKKIPSQPVFPPNHPLHPDSNKREVVKNGKSTLWYGDGQKKLEKNYKDNKKDGKWTVWYENGQIKSEGNYKDDKQDGKWTWWHENGQKWSEGNYKDDKQDGKWTVWYENGQIKSEGNYKDDKQDGKWTWWYKNGQKKEEHNYKDGKHDGKWTRWNENGIPVW